MLLKLDHTHASGGQIVRMAKISNSHDSSPARHPA
jgi:hypothetical protein